MKRIFLFCTLIFPLYTQAQITSQSDRERAEALAAQMTLEEKIDYIGGYNDFYIRAVPRLGIPEIRMADGPQGVRNQTQSTMYPSGVAAAASWNRDAVRDMGVGLGQDSRARGVHILLGPGVNIYRSPLCGRNFEYFGEDPYLTSETAIAYIRGVQSQGVMATVKHFAGNNQEYRRHHTSSDIDQRTLHEIYFPAFRRAVQEAGVGAVMSSYNLLNGVHASENSELIQGVLRDKWGFDGIHMSDWNATYSAVATANNGLDLEMPYARFMNRDYLLPAIETGIVTEETITAKVVNILSTLIAFGFLDRPQVDETIPENNPFSRDAALRVSRESIVMLKNDGLLPLSGGNIVVTGPCADTIFTGGGSGFVHPFMTNSVLKGMQGAGKRYRVADLSPKLTHDLTAGDFFVSPGSNERGLTADYHTNMHLTGKPFLTRAETAVDYSWGSKPPLRFMPADEFSVRWSGVLRPSHDYTMRLCISGDDGYRILIDGEEVAGHWSSHRLTERECYYDFEKGREYTFAVEYFDDAGGAEVHFSYEIVDLTQRERAIKAADAVVLCVGFSAVTEKENSDRTFHLPAGQDELIEQIASLNDNVVVVVMSGGGVDMTRWLDKVGAVLMAWYPGQEGGLAVAEVVTGKISPSGKLPFSIEKRWKDNPVYDSYYPNLKNAYRGQTFERVQYTEGVFVGYRGYDRSGVEPLFPFGYGLSYSRFDYGNLNARRHEGGVTVTFDVTNTGTRDAAEVAQVYVKENSPVVPRPGKELKAYEKLFLRKGETRTVTVELGPDAFSYYDVSSGGFRIQPGEFTISAGSSSADLPLRQTIRME